MRISPLLVIALFTPAFLMAQFKKEMARVKPVVLTIDPAIFQPNAFWIDSKTKLQLSYDGIRGLEFDFALFRKGSTSVELFIEEPSYIRIEGAGSQLVYPGEQIGIKFNSDQSALLFYSLTNKSRSKDFSIAASFYDSCMMLDRNLYTNYQFMPATSAKDLLQAKSEVTSIVMQATTRKRILLDSLLRSYNPGKEIRIAMTNKIIADSLSTMYSFLYSHHADLVKYGLFYEHLVQLTQGFGKAMGQDGFTMQMKYELSKLLELALKTKGLQTDLRNEQNYEDYRNVIDSFFNGSARAFLWSSTLLDCLNENIPLSPEAISVYKADIGNAGYKSIIEAKLLLREARNSAPVKPGTPRLISAISDKETTLESLLKKYKGKLVLIDFWHSMYGPCREDFPAFFNLQNEFKNQVEFIYISVEDSYTNWIRASKTEKIDPPNSYLLLEGRKADLSAYKLRTTGRYLLVGKDGTILVADAPRPSDKKLKALIEQHL